MVSLVSLWLPIVVAAVLVFVASSLVHMVVGYHRTDWRKAPGEDDILDAVQRAGVPAGDFVLPHMTSAAAAKTPEAQARHAKGHVTMTVLPAGGPPLGRLLGLWFVYCLVVGVFAAYVAGIVLAPGTPYLLVFRLTGTVAFTGYALALWQNTIWQSRGMAATLKSTVDGLVYALLTAGAFGWLWPR